MTLTRQRPCTPWRIAAPGALVLATLLASVPSVADAQADAPPAPEAPPPIITPELEQAARDAVERLVARLGVLIEGLGLMIENLPAYDAPRMLPNGDILIPRRRPESEPTPEAPDTLDL